MRKSNGTGLLNLPSVLKGLKGKEGTEFTRQKAELLMVATKVAEPPVQLRCDLTAAGVRHFPEWSRLSTSGQPACAGAYTISACIELMGLYGVFGDYSKGRKTPQRAKADFLPF